LNRSYDTLDQERLDQLAPGADEAAAIEPIVRTLREEMWRAQPDLGLWYAMSFALCADRRIFPRFDYETRPVIAEQPADLVEARADLDRAPSPVRWVPSWLFRSNTEAIARLRQARGRRVRASLQFYETFSHRQ